MASLWHDAAVPRTQLSSSPAPTIVSERVSTLAGTARLPKEFYKVSVVNSHGKLRTYDLGGKTYADEKAAKKQLDRLRSQGVECDLYWSPATWVLVDKQPELDGQEELF